MSQFPHDMVNPEERLRETLLRTSASKFVFMTFTSEWCAPCKNLYKSLKKWYKKNSDDVHVLIIDVAKYPTITQQFDVQGVPTLVVVRNNAIVHRRAGIYSHGHLKTLLKESKKKFRH
ncbi:MAG: thioredoxin family protein [Magnetococcales bacterium]|nr:thioredoxin family protein [Magnetococcales bacterium]